MRVHISSQDLFQKGSPKAVRFKGEGSVRTCGLVPRKPRGAQKLEADPQQDTPLDFQGTASRSCGLFFKRAGQNTSPVAELFGGLKGKPRGRRSPFWGSNLKNEPRRPSALRGGFKLIHLGARRGCRLDMSGTQRCVAKSWDLDLQWLRLSFFQDGVFF